MATRKTNAKNKTTSNNKTKIIAGAIGIAVAAGGAGYAYNEVTSSPDAVYTVTYYRLGKAKAALNDLEVRVNDEATLKYNYNGYVPADWAIQDNGCKTRANVLARSLESIAMSNGCDVQSGELFDYYTGETITLDNGIDVDHVVAKKNAWDSGGYDWNQETWKKYFNDDLHVLIATLDSANRSKGSKDAADWLPENTEYWCKYVIEQIEIKKLYNLSVRQAEKNKMQDVLTNNCKTK